MRDLAAIDLEISSTMERLAALRRERAEARQSRDRAILAMFDTGKGPAEIGRAFGLSRHKVHYILDVNGKSVQSREAIRLYQVALDADRSDARP